MSNNEIEIFKNEEFGEIRTVVVENEPWFVAGDVCKALDLSNTTVVVDRLDEDEKSKLNLGLSGGATNCVNEYGLYSLVLSSRKPEAKEFKRWITHEVIPAIRRTGGYVNDEELFVETFFPYASEASKAALKSTFSVLREQNKTIKKQKKEIAHKEEVIIGLVDDISLADKRQVLNRVVRYKGANYQERWRVLYREFENKYHISLNARFERYNNENAPKCRNKLEYIDRVMGKLPELYEIAAKLYENDVKALVEEMYYING